MTEPAILKRRPPRRWLVRLLVASVALMGAALIAGLYTCHVLRQTPFMAGPDGLSICGRDFIGPGYVYNGDQLRQDNAERIGTVMTWQGRREVWGRHVTILGAPGCGTGVYLRVGQDTFRGYALGTAQGSVDS